VKLAIDPARSASFTVYLRWPAWAPSADVLVNGQPTSLGTAKRGSYIALSRTWNPGDSISLSLPMQAVVMAANPRVTDTYGRVALQRGPLVYALEQIDQAGLALGDLFIRPAGPITTESRRDLLGGVSVLKISGQAAERSISEEPLYQPLAAMLNRAKRLVTLTFIPYYAIGNRDPSPMAVWVPVTRDSLVSSSAPPAAEKRPAAQ
jgi:hypothetical protein